MTIARQIVGPQEQYERSGAAEDLKLAHQGAGDALRKELNVTVSMLSRQNAPRTGTDLIRFQADPPAPPAPPKDKEEKKDDK